MHTRLTDAQAETARALNIRLLTLSREHHTALRTHKAAGVPMVHPKRMLDVRANLWGFRGAAAPPEVHVNHRHTYGVLAIAQRHPLLFSHLTQKSPMLDSNPTTRRHPRTTGEAFKDAAYASAIEPPREDEGMNGWGGVVLAVAIGLFGAWFLITCGLK